MDDKAAEGARWAVVGGGILGLTLALGLARRGHDVTVFEAAPEFGGLASAWTLGDVTWDRHYHVTLASDLATLRLLSDLGIADEMRWTATRTGCFGDGRLHSVSGPGDYLKLPILNPVDKFRLALTLLRASRITDWTALEQVSVESWLTRWSGPRVYQRFWRPLLISKLGAAHEQTSAAFIWATIRRLTAARRLGIGNDQFGYVEGGYARILSRFAEVLQAEGVKLIPSARISEIRTDGQSLRIAHGGKTEVFDRVVITAAPAIAARLCPDLQGAERDRLMQTNYLGIVCASLVLSRPLSDYYVTNIVDDGFRFTGIIEMTALVQPDTFGGRSLVYLPRYLAPGDDFAVLSDDTIRAQFIADLQRVFPDLGEDEILAFRVSRAGNVMAIPEIGYSGRVQPPRTSIPGVYLVNSSQIVNGTLNVNETVTLAERALNGDLDL